MENTSNNIPLLVEDMIFATRNQAYGAYLLRKTYNKRVTRSIIGGVLFFTIAVASPFIWELIQGLVPADKVEKVKISEVDLLPPPPIDKNEPPPPPVEPPPPLKSTIKFLPPVVKKDEEVQEDPPKVEELEKVDPGTKTQEGNDAGVDLSLLEGNNEEAKAVIEEPDQVFTVVEKMPEFPGGEEALLGYLSKNIKYPALARENGITGTVYVSFVIAKNGNVTNVKIARGIGGGCDEEAKRVVESMPNWSPGKQNGREVSVSYNVPVKFRLQ